MKQNASAQNSAASADSSQSQAARTSLNPPTALAEALSQGVSSAFETGAVTAASQTATQAQKGSKAADPTSASENSTGTVASQTVLLTQALEADTGGGKVIKAVTGQLSSSSATSGLVAQSLEAAINTEAAGSTSTDVSTTLQAPTTVLSADNSLDNVAGSSSSPTGALKNTSQAVPKTASSIAASTDLAAAGSVSSNQRAAIPTGINGATGNSHADLLQQAQAQVDRVTNVLEAAFSPGGEMRVRFEPPQLGKVQIEVSTQNGGILARLQVETPAAQQTIMDNISTLHDAIAQAGAPLSRIEVELTPPHSDDSGANRQRSGDSQSEFNQRGAQDQTGGQPNSGQQKNRSWQRSSAVDELDIEI